MPRRYGSPRPGSKKEEPLNLQVGDFMGSAGYRMPKASNSYDIL